MMDEMFDRHYQAGRADLNAGIVRAVTRLAHAAGNAFEALHRIQYSAPWRAMPGRARLH